MRNIVVAAALVFLAGCVHSPTAPEVTGGLLSPSGSFLVVAGSFGPATEFHAAKADEYWSQVEHCVRKTARVSGVPVYLMAPEGTREDGVAWFHCPEGNYREGVGGCLIDHSRMYVLGDIAAHSDWAESWRHEMIHLLLWHATGDDGLKDPDHWASPPRGVWTCAGAP